jgi:hypothetical protein
MKLGKKTARIDSRTLQYKKYAYNLVTPSKYTLPNDLADFDFGTMLNDTLGDCTCAAVGHAIQVWTYQARFKMVTVSDTAILSLYEVVGDYDPAVPSSDGGAVELDVLNYWTKNPVAGNTLSAYVALQPKSQQELQAAVYYFGGAYIGLQLPQSAQNQTLWNVPFFFGKGIGNGRAGTWGGHAVFIVGYNETGPICITWGKQKQMTWGFYEAYCDEAYALLSSDWLKQNLLSPTGLNLVALQTDLAIVKSL